MKKRILEVISILISTILILIGYYFLNKNYHYRIPCIFHEITGLYCPGCGTTRLIFALLEGHIKEAFNYNRLVFILLPFIISYYIYYSYLYIFNKKDNIIYKIKKIYIYILLSITILFGILRNIDTFSYLKP